MAHLISEIIQNKPSLQLTQTLRSRSLYDVLVSENPRTEDKRTIVVIRSIQQQVDVRWVPTTLQWADTLTKLSDKLVMTFVEWLRRPWIQLREMSAERHSTQKKNTSVKFQDQPHGEACA